MRAPVSALVNDSAGARLTIAGRSRAASYTREIISALTDRQGALSWSWRVLRAPRAADLRAAATDDSPIRVFVVFGKPNGPFAGSTHIIYYTFGNGEPEHYERSGFASARLHVVRMNGATDIGRWHDHTVQPMIDFERIWGGTPPPISAIGVMQDTDQTQGEAEAELRKLDWRTVNAAPTRSRTPSEQSSRN